MKLKIIIPVIFILCLSGGSIAQINIATDSNEPPNKSAASIAAISQKSLVPADTVDLTILCAVGMRQVMLGLVPEFEKRTGFRIAISFNSSGEIVKWIESGKPVDIIIILRSGVEHLIATEKIAKGSATNIATSRVGVAVRKGAHKPDISTTDAFKNAMLEAQSIACPDPARGGASGTYIDTLFGRLGIAESVRHKLVFSSTPGDEKAMPGYLVAEGKAEIALHQMQELLAVPGIDIVGPLPAGIQETFDFTAAITDNAERVDAAWVLIQFLITPEARELIKRKGME